MQQYFDHHLRGHEAPKWMTDGVPYAEREKEKHEFRPPKIPVETPAVTPAAATEIGSQKQQDR